jgi:hypothetical protein
VLKKRFGVATVGLFGSVVRGEERPKSDVDVLVTFRKGAETFGTSMDCTFYRENLFGRKGRSGHERRDQKEDPALYFKSGYLCGGHHSSTLTIFSNHQLILKKMALLPIWDYWSYKKPHRYNPLKIDPTVCSMSMNR